MDEKLQRLIEGLNADLNAEINTIIRYIRHSSVLKGIAGHEVRELLREEIMDEVKHATYIADKIVAIDKESGKEGDPKQNFHARHLGDRQTRGSSLLVNGGHGYSPHFSGRWRRGLWRKKQANHCGQ